MTIRPPLTVAAFAAGFAAALLILPDGNGETLPRPGCTPPPVAATSAPTPPPAPVQRVTMSPLEDAVWAVETSRRLGAIVGDGGRSLGPLQCGRLAYLDACEHDPTLSARPYEDVVDLAYALRVFRAYVDRWAGPDADDMTKARIWNGGPRGDRKSATLAYAAKVRDILGR